MVLFCKNNCAPTELLHETRNQTKKKITRNFQQISHFAHTDSLLVKYYLRPDTVLWRDEVLNLHLLELPGTEDEVARGNLVAERLAHLRDPERYLCTDKVTFCHNINHN